MIGIVGCLASFVAVYVAAKKSLGWGIVALLAIGYFYGIARANYLSTATYFIFDSAVIALYLSQNWTNATKANSTLRGWLLLLIAWPTLLVFLPFQPLLVSLVGLRGIVFFLPIAFLGSRLRGKDLHQIAIGLAVLNLVALAFAGLEYFQGVPRFYPRNAATTIIYITADLAGGFFRIPAIFSSSHAYSGAMVDSLPYLLGMWAEFSDRKARLFALVGAGAALLGILMSGSRSDFVIGAALVLVVIWNRKLQMKRRLLFLAIIVVMMASVLSNSRLTRFKSLSDTDYVEGRIAGSVNRGFFELLFEYPMGNGLGGGGSSIPYFLQGQVRNPIAMENEYARILCEQGIIGFVLWGAFLFWFMSRLWVVGTKGSWTTTRRFLWGVSIVDLISGAIGLGLFSSIPGTTLLLMGMGYVATPAAAEVAPRRNAAMRPAIPQRSSRRAPAALAGTIAKSGPVGRDLTHDV